MQQLIDVLHREQCSLVLRDARGGVHTYNKKGVRDLEDIYNRDLGLLRGAVIADKVIGKAAAAYMVAGGSQEVYADVMSKHALPLFCEAGIRYSYGELVDRIVIAEGDNRCPLESIVSDCNTPQQIIDTLEEHFAEMKRKRGEG